MWGMATTHQLIALFDRIELRESFGAAPAGAQGAVIGFIKDGTVVEVEIMKPDLDILDRIVDALPSQLRRTDAP
jgi:hypothetical protein